MDLLTMAQLDGQGCFEDAEENPQLEGAPPLTWTESAAARQAAEAARSLKERGDFGAAAEQYAAALSAGHPNRAACHGKRADCLGRVGRLEEALAEFERAVELAPTSGAHRYGKAYTLRMLGPPLPAPLAPLPSPASLLLSSVHTKRGPCAGAGREGEARECAAAAAELGHKAAQALLVQLAPPPPPKGAVQAGGEGRASLTPREPAAAGGDRSAEEDR